MTKADLVSAIVAKAGLTKKDAEKALNATIDAISESLADGEKVQLVGFGSFEIHELNERPGRNPKTKEPIIIPASKKVHFKPGKQLKVRIQ